MPFGSYQADPHRSAAQCQPQLACFHVPMSRAPLSVCVVWMRPPMRPRPSTTTTSTPWRCKIEAARKPLIPAPTTTTRFLVSGSGSPCGPEMNPVDAGTSPTAVFVRKVEISADASTRPEPILGKGLLGGLLLYTARSKSQQLLR